MSFAELRSAVLRNRVGRTVYMLGKHLDDHHALLGASAMAFDAFLSFIPLMAFAGAIVAYLNETSDVLVGPFGRAAPGPVRDIVVQELGRIAFGDVAAFAPVSIAAFIWVSSSGLSTAMYVFENIFHSKPRPWWWRRMIAIGAIIGGVAALLIVIALAVLIASLSGSWGARAIAFLVPAGVLVGLVASFFRIAIRGPRPLKRRMVPGAVVTVVLWAIVSAVFSYYVSTLSRYTTLYGGLAAVAIFLFWLWLLALALLVGGEVNAQLEGVRDEADNLAKEAEAGEVAAAEIAASAKISAAINAAERTGSGT
ncbi:MAG: YihY/virulence factor BrkB family protein [Byssovorax sp.]